MSGHPWNAQVAPTIRQDGDQERASHPAFGVVQVSRPSGGHTVLMGSDFRHCSCVSITVSEAEEVRSLSNTWNFPRRQIVQFELSEAQFAHMVASAGVGGGTPCTIRWADGEHKPQIVLDEHQTDKFGRELRDDLSNAVSAINDAIKALDEGGNAKQRKMSQDALRRALRALTDSAPFVAKQFDEHMNAVTEQAKTEAHAALLRAVQVAGIKRLSIEDHSQEPNT
jgi:hypothetical protein